MSTLHELIDECCRRPALAPKTRKVYREALARFLDWATEQGHDRPEALTPAVIDDYARHLETLRTRKRTPLALASRKSYLQAVQQLLSWLQSRHHVEEVDPKQVGLPRLRRKHRDVLTRQEIQALEDAASSERNKLVVRLMADTGAREGEVAAVQVTDLITRDGRYHFVRLRGKTGERLAPVRPELARRLRAHAAGKTGRPRTSSPFLFISRRRPTGEHEPLTEDGVYQAVKDAVARAELDRRIYPHLLRHSAITWMVSQGMHPALISDVTGVSVAVIASNYSHPSDRQRYEAMMRVLDN